MDTETMNQQDDRDHRDQPTDEHSGSQARSDSRGQSDTWGQSDQWGKAGADTWVPRSVPAGQFARREPLRRPFEGRMLAGVAAGIARNLNLDPTMVRIAFVVLTVLGGAGLPLYLAGLLLIPEEGSDQSIASSLIESFQARSR